MSRPVDDHQCLDHILLLLRPKGSSDILRVLAPEEEKEEEKEVTLPSWRRNELQARLPALDKRVTSITLDVLEDAGLIRRAATAGATWSVTYALTSRGLNVWRLVRKMQMLAGEHGAELGAAIEEKAGGKARRP